MTIALYADEILGSYGYEEKPWFLPHLRQQAFLDHLRAAGWLDRVDLRGSVPATEADLTRFHTPEHVRFVRERCATDEGALDHGATSARRSIERAANHVAGTVRAAAEAILADPHIAFVPIAGFHHAHPDVVRMYCLYNDAGVALAWLREHVHGPIAYVDVDVHQGDGVYAGFAADPQVVMADLHEDWRTLWPHSPDEPGEGTFRGRPEDDGEGAGRGTVLNRPLPPGTQDDAFLAAWEEAEAFVRAARPRFVILLAGVDGLAGDPMAHLALTPAVFRTIAARAKRLADEVADGRLLVLGGGGYLLENAVAGWTAVLEGLAEG